MPANVVDAFILFNEQEAAVENVVKRLGEKGVSTYFLRRDIAIGQPWSNVEDTRLADAKAVVVFLGGAGWGPTHRKLTEAAFIQKKRIIPVLIGNPDKESLEDLDGLFTEIRYLDLREPSEQLIDQLAQEILRDPNQDPGSFAQGWRENEGRKLAHVERIISILVDGNEEERAWALKQVRTSPLVDPQLMSARLRDEIEGRFSAESEQKFQAASRDPKKFSSIRSWMMSCLIWADVDSDESRTVILNHLYNDKEPDRNVRFWVLAGLYQRKPTYLDEALEVTINDGAPEVFSLQQAITEPARALERFTELLREEDYETVWVALRVLRIVAIPELIERVCQLFFTAETNSALAYDSLYALSNPEMAASAAKLITEQRGIEEVVRIVIAVSVGSNRTARRSFCVLLAAFEPKKVDEQLKQAEQDRQTGPTARALRLELAELRKSGGTDEVFIAGYASDSIDIHNDRLEIQEDVKTLVAVMLAKEVEPPLAIGLFGDWGTGKSFFMKSMIAAVDDLAGKSTAPDSKFCTNIVQIEFNAWHYIDANLWASLVSYILEQLAAYVAPEKSVEEQQAALLTELSTAKTIVAEAEAEKKGAQNVIDNRQAKLQELQLQREQKEVELSDLRLSDLANLLSENKTLKVDLEDALKEIGAPVALERLSDLSSVVSDAHSLHGRAVALFMALVTGKNRRTILILLLIVLLGIPLVAYLVHSYRPDSLLVTSSAIIAQVTGLITGATVLLRRAFNVANGALGRIEQAKQRVDQLLAEKRQNPSEAEKTLQTEIASLKAQEKEASARVAAAAARVVELEERIRAIQEGRSLARFLGERVRSEDYRKHLGLISTIRRDFESLAVRLANARTNPEKGFRPADRIILYIDDLDRCPERRVMDVLQAVHLLLAYKLFVVVVGVDPRWLLHSLGSTYGAFNSNADDDRPDKWRTTPQNYLEKIFQIPFSLRPMTDTGYGRLVSNLLSSDRGGPPPPQIKDQQQKPQPPPPDDQKPDPDTDQKQKQETNGADGDRKTPSPSPDPDKDATKKDEFEIQDEALIINAWEASFAVKLYSFIPSPRAAKRFSNVYRILKAHVGRENLRQFEGTAELPGDFQIPMLLLAMLIGAPAESAVLFPILQKHAWQEKDVLEVFHDLHGSGLEPNAAASLSAKLEPIIGDDAFPSTPSVFTEWLPRVSRFSFELGRMVQPMTATRS